MKAVIAGSTGMVGSIVLDLCVKSDLVTDIVTLVRRPSGAVVSDKVNEVVVDDFESYANQEVSFAKIVEAHAGEYATKALFKHEEYEDILGWARV